MFNDPTYENIYTQYCEPDLIELDSICVGLELQSNEGCFKIISVVEGDGNTTQIATIQFEGGRTKLVDDSYLEKCYKW